VATDDTIYWKDDTFANGAARFGAFPDGVFYAVFTELWPDNMTLATLIAVDGMFPVSQWRLRGSLERRADRGFSSFSRGL